MTSILDSTDYCPECLGTGVVVLKNSERWPGSSVMERCDKCKRFETDSEAVEAAEELVRGVYANNRRACELNAGIVEVLIESCEECPCCYVDISEIGHPPEHRCNLLDREVFVYVNKIDKDCPIKTKTYILRTPMPAQRVEQELPSIHDIARGLQIPVEYLVAGGGKKEDDGDHRPDT